MKIQYLLNAISKNNSLIAFLLVAWTIFRNGIRIQGPGELGLSALQYFPTARYYVSESFGPLLFGKIFGLNNSFRWSSLYLVLTLTTIYMAYFFALKNFGKLGFLYSLAFSISPYIITLLQQIGHYDYFTIVGWLIYYLGFYNKNNLLKYIGLTIAASGNPEQALLSVISIYLICRYKSNAELQKEIKSHVAYVLLLFIFIQVWMTWYGASGRLFLVVLYLIKSTTFFLQTFPNSYTSLYGIFWLPIIFYLFQTSNKFSKLLPIVIIPLLATILAVDGTRIFSCVSLPILLFLIVNGEFDDLLSIVIKSRDAFILFLAICLFFPFSYVLVGANMEPFGHLRSIFSQMELSYTEWLRNLIKNGFVHIKDWPVLSRFSRAF